VFFIAVIVFPVLLLVLLLSMERVERPLGGHRPSSDPVRIAEPTESEPATAPSRGAAEVAPAGAQRGQQGQPGQQGWSG
jgi:hypothetical protein